MKINPSIMVEELFTQLSYDVLANIVTEACVRALPLNKEQVAERTSDIHQYVRASLESMDAASMINDAMENATDDAKKAYLYNLIDAVYSTSWQAAKRIANENAEAPDLGSVIKDRSFTSEEIKRLQSKANDLSIPAMAKIINKKVVGVLKDEKIAYEKEEELRQELRDVVSANNEEVANKLNLQKETAEIDKPVNPNDPTQYHSAGELESPFQSDDGEGSDDVPVDPAEEDPNRNEGAPTSDSTAGLDSYIEVGAEANQILKSYIEKSCKPNYGAYTAIENAILNGFNSKYLNRTPNLYKSINSKSDVAKFIGTTISYCMEHLDGAAFAKKLQFNGVLGPRNLSTMYMIDNNDRVMNDSHGIFAMEMMAAIDVANRKGIFEKPITAYAIESYNEGMNTKLGVFLYTAPVNDSGEWMKAHMPNECLQNKVRRVNHGHAMEGTIPLYHDNNGVVEQIMIDAPTEVSLESVMTKYVDKNAPLHHISLFSKIQDTAMEAILNSGVKIDNELPIQILKIVTESTVFPDMNNLDEDFDAVFESLQVASEGFSCDPNEAAKIAHITSIVVYTVLEVLKTMNLYSPPIDKVRRFVDGTPSVRTPEDIANGLQNRLMNKITDIRNRVPIMNQSQVAVAYDSCNRMRDEINEIGDKYPTLKEKVMPTLESLIDLLANKTSEMVVLPAKESTTVTRLKNINAAQYTRIANLYGKREDVREFIITPATEGAEVRVLGNYGSIIGVVDVDYKMMPEMGDSLQVTMESLQNSNLMNCIPAIYLYDQKTANKKMIKDTTY